MKNKIHLASRSEVCQGNARSNICHRDGPWPRLLLAMSCAVLAGLAPPAQAAVTEAWVHRYSNVVSNSADRAFKVVRDAANDIIVTGNTDDGVHGQDILTIKYSGADGSVLWKKRYNGPANSDDSAAALAVDSSGNVVVTGSSVAAGTYPDFYTVKYAAADGTLLWERRYNGPADGLDSATAVALDGTGNVVVTGTSLGSIDSFGNQNTDYYTAKYATADGALLWEKRYNSPWDRNDNAIALVVDGSGNVLVTGSSYGTNTLDIYTAKYGAADGALLWEQRFAPEPLVGPSVAVPAALALDSSGNVVVTGGIGYKQPSLAYTAKYAATNGALFWEKRGPGNGYGHATAVTVDGSGDVVVTGFSHNGDPNDGSDFHTAKYAAADGALLWERRSNGPAHYINNQVQAVVVDRSGNVVVAWSSYDSGSQYDSYTSKYAVADGAVLWEKRSNGPANSYDWVEAMAVDGSGNVVVTGNSDNGTNSDYYTAKYAAVDGAVLWAKRYNHGPANNDAQARAVALDASGNVAVMGNSYNGPSYHGPNSDYYTAKYAVANGALLWEQRYNGPANNSDSAAAMAVDGSGNVVVTGGSYGSDGNADYYTAKYAAGDGALLWEQRYNGPANNSDSAEALAVDGSGNVIVSRSSGSSTNGAPNYDSDFYTAKYAASDGTLLWEKRYNGPANSYDQAQAVAVDGSGNVVVTGSSVRSIDLLGNQNRENHDYYTAKYAAADGALLWEKRYNGPANSYDQARAVAVDGSGNVVVAGTSVGSIDSFGNQNFDYYTAKYAAADGALLWEKRYNGPANSYEEASAVVVDGNGNVIVTGVSDYNSYTAKYAASDGALIWERRYSGPENNNNAALSVAVDDSGNAVVTGYSYNGVNTDYYTAKYAATDGALLWEKRYNGPANGDDRVGGSHSLALGPDGIVAITGSSDGNFGSGTTGNFTTILYRENLSPVTITLVPTGIRLRFTGTPGISYTIERAPAVTGPWSTLATPATPIDGIVEYVDINPPSGTAFYRTSTP